jgi:hypothetical protein
LRHLALLTHFNVLCVSTAIFVGCSASSNPHPDSQTSINSAQQPILSKTFDPMATLPAMQLPPLTCTIAGGCPAAIGQLVTATVMHGVSFCTVSLITEDTVITAAHCIPYEIIDRKQNSFTGGCWVRWMTVNGVENWAACRDLLHADLLSSDHEAFVQQDLAAIRLVHAVPQAKLPGGILRISQIARENTIHAPGDFSFIGILPTTNQHSIFMNFCRHEPGLNLQHKPTSPLNELRLANCQAEGGNSGAPVLNVNGEITAIVSFKSPGSLLGQLVPSVVATMVPANYAMDLPRP